MKTWRGVLLEFGPAELLDTGLIRPIAMGIGSNIFGDSESWRESSWPIWRSMCR
jgi:hypothetical protein